MTEPIVSPKEVEVAQKVRVLTDVTIECDPPQIWGCNTPERTAKAYESWVREFNDFIRDHRSQDDVRLRVVRVVQDQCSLCGHEWETMLDEQVICCAYCAAPVAP